MIEIGHSFDIKSKSLVKTVWSQSGRVWRDFSRRDVGTQTEVSSKTSDVLQTVTNWYRQDETSRTL